VEIAAVFASHSFKLRQFKADDMIHM